MVRPGGNTTAADARADLRERRRHRVHQARSVGAHHRQHEALADGDGLRAGEVDAYVQQAFLVERVQGMLERGHRRGRHHHLHDAGELAAQTSHLAALPVAAVC